MTARLASRCSTRLTHASSSPTSWEITTRPPLWLRRNSRSHTIESASRWLVGSSRSSVSAPENRIRASSTRRRWPPERVRSGWSISRSSMPSEDGDLRRLGLGRVAAGRVQGGVGLLVAPHRPVADVAGRRCPSRSRPPGGGVRRSRGRAPRGSGRARAPRGHRCAGPAAGSRPSPTAVTVPPAGRPSPARIRVSVVLPAPLRPTRPIRSPARDPEGHVVHQQARAGTHLELGDSDHDRTFDGWSIGAGGGPASWGGAAAGYCWAARPLVYEACRAKGPAMRFNPKARIDQSQIETAQRRRAGGGGGDAPPRARRGWRQGRPGHDRGHRAVRRAHPVHRRRRSLGAGGVGRRHRHRARTAARPAPTPTSPRTCAVDLFTNSVQDFWTQAYPQQTGRHYEPSRRCASQGIDRPPGAAPASSDDGAVLLPERPHGLPRHHASSTTCSRASSARRAAPSRSAT